VRAEFTRYAIDKTEAAFGDINYFSVSGLFSFGIR